MLCSKLVNVFRFLDQFRDLVKMSVSVLGACTHEGWLKICKPIIEKRMQKY